MHVVVHAAVNAIVHAIAHTFVNVVVLVALPLCRSVALLLNPALYRFRWTFSGFSGTWPPRSTAALLGVGSAAGVWITSARLLRHLPTSCPRLSLSLSGPQWPSLSSPMNVFPLLVFVDRWSPSASSCSADLGLVAQALSTQPLALVLKTLTSVLPAPHPLWHPAAPGTWRSAQLLWQRSVFLAAL